MNTINNALEKYGLNKNEIALYLASLQLGDAGMSELAKKAGLKRTTAYTVADSLIEKGLLGSFNMKSGARYVAKSPKKLVADSRIKLDLMNAIAPELENLITQDKNKPKVTFFTGRDAYLRIMDESLKKPNVTLRHIGSLAEGHNVTTPEYGKKYLEERIKKNIKLKAIYARDFEHNESSEKESRKLRQIKYLPETYKGKTLTLVFEDTVIITTSKKDVAIIVIESKEIAQAEKEKFDLLWSLVK